MTRYCRFAKKPNCICEKCDYLNGKVISGGSNIICGKCGDRCASSIRELKQKHPHFKSLLEKWNGGNEIFICSQCWKKDIVERAEASKSVSSCSQCSKKFKDGDTFYTLTWEGRKLAFCSQNCSKNYAENLKTQERKEQKQKAEHIRKQKEKQLDAKIKQQLESLSKDMEAGNDISHYNWENSNWMSDEMKEICRNYVQNRKEYDELNRQKDNPQKEQNYNPPPTDDSSNDNGSDNSETCSKCGFGGVKYEHKSKNDGKKFCSQSCFASYYSPSNSPNQPSDNSPSQNNTPQEIPNIPPPKNNNSPNNNPPKNNPPKRNYSIPTIHFPNTNATQQENFRKALKEMIENERLKKKVVIPIGLTKQQNTFLNVLQNAIQTGEISYDKHDLPKNQKEKMEEIIRQLESVHSQEWGGGGWWWKRHRKKILIGGAIVIIFFILLVLIIRKKKLNTK
ncbi:MAG: hypothetical protein I3270_01475 [Candidatus Moeniiplasma glomeromycotorum]|nr:hypothetical protein [Candidatus Moeniiplasma glomeromycotorum]MCE8162378.1 hypothetical protein [Candidatus Moeniiplasma glomeromycotorum]MCE8166303.1 hypothetical protein [Candidatus Moeniiplasma glomeromycotorum]MCE8166785.1 hypothetical protein [Candidatus Moeniiplasma glomeromycotorum]